MNSVPCCPKNLNSNKPNELNNHIISKFEEKNLNGLNLTVTGIIMPLCEFKIKKLTISY